jgi:choline dehydrogenase-like flavoprotein
VTPVPTPQRSLSDPPARAEVIIVGSGAGGAAVAYGLRALGRDVVVLERGGYLPHEPENWDADAVFRQARYKTTERWYDRDDKAFRPGVHYAVGGNTKVYGASLPRFRTADFTAAEHADGISPAWPISYDDLEPYYVESERLYRVHGEPGDQTDPPRSGAYPFPAVPHEPAVAVLADRLRAAGYTPSYLPLGIDLRPDGRCIRCATCDGFPCLLDAKSDAETTCIRPAVGAGVRIVTHATVHRVVTDVTGSMVTGVEFEHNGQKKAMKAPVVVVAAGAVNTAALLLRSSSAAHPAGLANSSGVVGRYYMVHNNTVMMALGREPTHVRFQKTLYVNDFYARGNRRHPYPLGHMQLIGKTQAAMLRDQVRFLPSPALSAVARRSSDWWLFTEDLPDPDNRVLLTSGGGIKIAWRANNLNAHRELVTEARTMMRRGGYPVVIARRMGIDVNSHQAGTVRVGADPSTSAVGPTLESHDVANLYVADASIFPSLPVMNPALTVAALGLRAARHVSRSLGADPSSCDEAAS